MSLKLVCAILKLICIIYEIRQIGIQSLFYDVNNIILLIY